ncbi:hypothetical protein HPP92_016858 [Vanilla planifolia]|uniref:Uncharacterized protein n=1 Tax=Vanilla planifolia TaxID=51239 RepID=A0A835USH1_VANPL|nr:hypothetical protein HPP92_016858 [Vanilla planifolia]
MSSLLDWARKMQQEGRLHLLVDRNVGRGSSVWRRWRWCRWRCCARENIPARRPRMSEVLRMLEGDGLAEKWQASNQLEQLQDAETEERFEEPSHDGMLFVVDGTNGSRSGRSREEVQEMELSGPR